MNIWILADARSGSNLLAQTLTQTGYFGDVQGFWIGQPDALNWKVLSHNYLTAHSGEHFAAKLSWAYVDRFYDAGGMEAINYITRELPTHYIYLFRQEYVAQAVSWYIAEHTKQWQSSDEQLREAPPYNRQAIDYLLSVIQGSHVRTMKFLKSVPKWFVMTYEELIADRKLEVNLALEWLGLPTVDSLPEPMLQRQIDPIKQEYIERYRKGK